MMKIGKQFKSLIMVGALLTLPLSALANVPEKKVIDYVAMGDSLAAGITPDGDDGLGYPDYIKQRFEQSQYTINFNNDSAKGGYTTIDLMKDMENESLRDAIKEAELITIDIGANDVLPVLNAFLVQRATPEDIDRAIENTTANIGEILNEIEGINPNAKVYVMGYYNPMPHILPGHQPLIEQLLETLNGAIEQVTDINGDTFVPTAKVIAKDPDTYLPNPEDIHLSEEGYQQIAKEFWKKIDKSKSN
ncbi:SGNH/GDSL hydrolase family protein [Bacillus dakarensis]|uniref:SGNH/GDSL hydrolase family protein n=1 Tax=Robertmurraya dakarensis TaxID=1926278 RepID=UPI001F31DABE|nr:GDSL-type esterase/lipase family protein [Bacillus dakarensis]